MYGIIGVFTSDDALIIPRSASVRDFLQQNSALLIIAISVILAGVVLSLLDNKNRIVQYRYRAKPIMTKREEEVFKLLVRVFEGKFFVVPQVHLGSILDYKIKGQNWHGAFQHINRKSVDYVLINRETLQTVCAVELDDRTHELKRRQERDLEVERILKEANIPLVRIRNLNGRSDREIIATFAEVINGE